LTATHWTSTGRHRLNLLLLLSMLCVAVCRLELNLTFFAVVAYSLYYLVLEPVAGLSWSACVGLPLWLTATAFKHTVAQAGLWALGVHVFSWYMQVGASDLI
jgi:uncharacterized membrane protein YGL010W